MNDWHTTNEEICYAHPQLRSKSREWREITKKVYMLYWLFPRNEYIAQPVVLIDPETLLVVKEGFE